MSNAMFYNLLRRFNPLGRSEPPDDYPGSSGRPSPWSWSTGNDEGMSKFHGIPGQKGTCLTGVTHRCPIDAGTRSGGSVRCEHYSDHTLRVSPAFFQQSRALDWTGRMSRRTNGNYTLKMPFLSTLFFVDNRTAHGWWVRPGIRLMNRCKKIVHLSCLASGPGVE